jgi:hypothetical protein
MAMPIELQVIEDLTTNMRKKDKDLDDSYEKNNRLTGQMIFLQEGVLKEQEVSLKALERLNSLVSSDLLIVNQVMVVNNTLTEQVGLLN